jgi:hypothetical protein
MRALARGGGEVVYQEQVHRGEHEPIVDRALFATVQDKLAAQAVARRCRLRGTPALLSGRLFDVAGHRMSPTHANKGGARYRYYVSQAVLQKKPHPPGSVSRVPAPELEARVLAALCDHLNANGTGQELPDGARDLIDRHIERVTLTPSEIRLRLRKIVEDASQEHEAESTANKSSDCCGSSAKAIVVPWASPLPANTKDIVYVPAHNTPIKAGRQTGLLIRDLEIEIQRPETGAQNAADIAR